MSLFFSLGFMVRHVAETRERAEEGFNESAACYNLGSMAFGSLIVYFVESVRSFLKQFVEEQN